MWRCFGELKFVDNEKGVDIWLGKTMSSKRSRLWDVVRR
jgi:hypothetical protein